MNEILWFASRATGVASLVTLTVVLGLGMLTASRRPPQGIRSAVVMGLHRSLALGASAFLLIHVLTAVVETYVDIDAISALVPFTSGYETAWVGLGTLALDLAAAVVVTSLLRHRLPEKVWRAVHLTAFALWPLAVVHGIALGTSDEPVLRGVTIASALAGVVMTTALADLLDESGLTGRGGAGFGTGVKVRAATSAGASLIVNACDGEYGAVKDGWVVAHHRDELVQGANLLGNNGIRYAVHRGSRSESLLRSAGLDVLSVPHRYVSSEESALVSLANGGLARPMTKRVPVVYGSVAPDGRRLPPTVVLNAETVWRVAQIADHGPGWFRSFGTTDEPGPRLASVSGTVSAPGVVETAAGVRVAELVDAAGGADQPVIGVGVGGLSGGWLSPLEVAGASWSRAGLAAYGFTPGPGTLHVLGAGSCPLRHVSSTLDHAAGESAGQCGPCMFGVPAVAEDFRLVVTGRANGVVWQRLQRRLGMLPGRGACRFPDGVAGYARSALRAFGDEVEAHLAGRCTVLARSRGNDAVTV